MVRVGVSVVDITPPVGLAMTGFGARTLPAEGVHDPLTARALVIGDTAIVVADVLGIEAAMSERIRTRCGLPASAVVVAAVHNHGGPVSMAGRLGADADPDYLSVLESGCVEAIIRAHESAVEASLHFGYGVDPDIARNRRHADGAVDRSLPVLVACNQAGEAIAVLTSYACHPVVLDATNLLWTADYPYFLRTEIEKAFPGAVCLFLTGCAGDLNTGHSAHASLSLAKNSARTFEAAQDIGRAIAKCAIAAKLEPIAEPEVAFAEEFVRLDFERREVERLDLLAQQWEAGAENASSLQSLAFPIWARWARRFAEAPLVPISARVSALRWGGLGLVALPGEVFAETSIDIRCLSNLAGFVICYADDNPGYIAPESEYTSGGYEVDEAHRYYGMPATFAKGSAEKLVGAASRALATAQNYKQAE